MSAQSFDSKILTHFNAGFKLNTQLAEYVNFGVYNVLFKTEGRDTQSEHAAQLLLLFKDGYAVTVKGCQIVGAGETCRAGTNYG